MNKIDRRKEPAYVRFFFVKSITVMKKLPAAGVQALLENFRKDSSGGCCKKVLGRGIIKL